MKKGVESTGKVMHI